MEKQTFDKNTLRKFGIIMGMGFLVITSFILIRHKHSIVPTFIASIIFFITSFITPVALKPIYIFWMKLGFVLSWINTRLILLIIFYLIFTPVGLVMKLLGKDLLDRKIEKNRESYWKKKERSNFSLLNYERQF